MGQEQVVLEAKLGTIDRLSNMTKKDVVALQASYAMRTLAEGRIHLGIARTKLLLALADWVKDFSRIGEEPSCKQFPRSVIGRRAKGIDQNSENSRTDLDPLQHQMIVPY
jgi:hypothetical protein